MAPENLESIFQQHHGLVFKAAYRVTGNTGDAEDVLQTVFLRLVRRGRDSAHMENVPSYLHRAAVNAALDLMRSRQNNRNIPLDDVSAVLTDPSASAPDRVQSSSELGAWIRAAVSRLNPTAAEMFALRYFEGKDNVEIAGMMGTTQGTVAVTLSRARDRMEKDYQLHMGGR